MRRFLVLAAAFAAVSSSAVFSPQANALTTTKLMCFTREDCDKLAALCRGNGYYDEVGGYPGGPEVVGSCVIFG